MATFKITPDPNSIGYRAEVRAIRNLGLSTESTRRNLDWLRQLGTRACKIADGYIKKIVWDKESGYPEHAWGYTQYTVRPFIQGYGCDGTTDQNIHLIAMTLCQRLGIDYHAAYMEAYASDSDADDVRAWLDEMQADRELIAETVIPEKHDEDELMLMLSDLYQINNRSLVDTLEEKLAACGINVGNWHQHEERLKRLAA